VHFLSFSFFLLIFPFSKFNFSFYYFNFNWAALDQFGGASKILAIPTLVWSDLSLGFNFYGFRIFVTCFISDFSTQFCGSLIAPLGFYPRFLSVITHSCGFSKKHEELIIDTSFTSSDIVLIRNKIYFY
jgi:hypothetical protein